MTGDYLKIHAHLTHDNNQHVLGNSKTLIKAKGINIEGIFTQNASNGFCSLIFEPKLVTTTAKTQYIPARDVFFHRLLRVRVAPKGEPKDNFITDATITDIMPDHRNAFVRRLDTKISFKIRITPKENTQLLYFDSYNIGSCYTPLIMISTKSEAKHHPNELIYLCIKGRATVNKAENTINLQPGIHYITAVFGNEPAKMLKDLSYLWEQPPKQNNRKIPKGTIERALPTVYAVKAHLSDTGLIFPNTQDSASYPMLQLGAMHIFAQTEQREEIERILAAYQKQYGADNCLNWSESKAPAFCEGSILPACFIIGVLLYGKRRLADTTFDILYQLQNLQTNSLVGGMLPFNGNEITPELYGVNYSDGSAIATLLYIKSTELYCRYAKIHDKPYVEHLRALKRVKKLFSQNFSFQNEVYINSTKRTFKKPYPRFIYGKCAVCRIEDENCTHSWLERTNEGYYLCEKCIYEGIVPKDEKDVQYPSTLPLTLACTLDLELFDKALEKQLLLEYTANVKSIYSTLDKATLLMALTRRRDPLAHEVYEHLTSLAPSSLLWAQGYDKRDKPLGRSYDLYASVAAAIAILDYNEHMKK